MELGQLEAFERAYRDRSFSRAAEALNLTQPSVSARIALLEQELGGPLFVRGGRKLHLTPLGRRFLPYAVRALAALDDGRQVVARFHTGETGQVTIAALNTMGIDLLPEPLARFRRQYPAVDVLIRRATSPEILDMLYDGTITLGLLGAPLFDRGICVQAHFQESVRAVVAVEHPLAAQQAAQGSLHMADIYPYTIFNSTLAPRVTAFIRGVVEDSRRHSGTATVTIPTVMVSRMLMLSEGVAFLPVSRVQHQVDAGRMVYLDIEDMPRLFNEPMLVSLRDRELDAHSAEFLQMVKSHWRHMLI